MADSDVFGPRKGKAIEIISYIQPYKGVGHLTRVFFFERGADGLVEHIISNEFKFNKIIINNLQILNKI